MLTNIKLSNLTTQMFSRRNYDWKYFVMSEEVIENWQHMIRKLAPLIEDAMVQVHTKEAEVKQLQAVLKLKALDSGIKTNSGTRKITFEKYIMTRFLIEFYKMYPKY